jgi:prepilin-type N-terminal cleavage/methylation domain-containing protein
MKRDTTHARAPAFTLVELVLVLAIAGLAAALAAPRYAAALSRYRVEAAARRVAADLQFAQAKARATGTKRAIRFNRDSNSYTLSGESGLSAPGSGYVVDLSLDPYRSSIATVSFAGAGSLVFNGFGVPGSAGFVTVRCGKETRTVSVDSGSGFTSIQ